MKNIFFSLALICVSSCIYADVSNDVIRNGAVCVVEDAKNCPICPVIEETKCAICGKPINHEDEVVVEGEEEGNEAKCPCNSKPKPKP